MRLLIDLDQSRYSRLQRFLHWLRTPTAGIVVYCARCENPLAGDAEIMRQSRMRAQSMVMCHGGYGAPGGPANCLTMMMVWS